MVWDYLVVLLEIRFSLACVFLENNDGFVEISNLVKWVLNAMLNLEALMGFSVMDLVETDGFVDFHVLEWGLYSDE